MCDKYPGSNTTRVWICEECLKAFGKPSDKWRQAEIELPKPGYRNQVLIYGKLEYNDNYGILMGWFNPGLGWCSLFCGDEESLHVTHWKPLPKPPVEV